MKEKVSIVIPCFNDFDFIGRSIQSALDQTYPNKEIIIVDDGSDLKTKTLLKSLEKKIDLLITQKNKGTSAARNAGIQAANGKFILVLDSDDYYEPDFCEKALRIFKDIKNIKMVTCHARWFLNEKDNQIFKPNGGDLKNFLIKNSSLGTMFLKKDWVETGGYDENLIKGFEDWEFYIRLHENGGETYVIPEVLFHYRKKAVSRNTKANTHKFELREYIYLKHAHLYKENFEIFVKHMLQSLQSEEKKSKKIAESKEYRLGKFLIRGNKGLSGLLKKL